MANDSKYTDWYTKSAESGEMLCLPEGVAVFPAAAAQWLEWSGITEEDIETYSIYYSPAMDRIVLPAWKFKGEAQELLGWQARSLIKAPKYYSGKGQVPVLAYSVNALSRAGPIVLVEDILSMIRVGRECPCIATIGTCLDKMGAKISKLREASDKFYIWYDPDEPGKKGALSLQKALTLTGAQATVLNIDEEPKYMSEGEVADYVSRAYDSQCAAQCGDIQEILRLR